MTRFCVFWRTQTPVANFFVFSFGISNAGFIQLRDSKSIFTKRCSRDRRLHCLTSLKNVPILVGRSQKSLCMRTIFPPSNISKWRTTNKISPKLRADSLTLKTSKGQSVTVNDVGAATYSHARSLSWISVLPH